MGSFQFSTRASQRVKLFDKKNMMAAILNLKDGGHGYIIFVFVLFFILLSNMGVDTKIVPVSGLECKLL